MNTPQGVGERVGSRVPTTTPWGIGEDVRVGSGLTSISIRMKKEVGIENQSRYTLDKERRMRK